MRFRSMTSVCLFLLALAGAWSVTVPARGRDRPVFRFGEEGPVGAWLTVSGFPDERRENPDRISAPSRGYGEDYLLSVGGEDSVRPEAGLAVRYGGRTLYFEESTTLAVPREVRLDPSGSVGDVSYAYCRIQSGEEREAWIHVRSPWYLRIRVNGSLLYAWDRHRSRLGQESFRIGLREGLNDLLVKYVSFDGRGRPAVFVTDEAGARARYTGEAGTLLELRSPGPGEGERHILADLRPARGLFPDVGVRIVVQDVYERTVAEADGFLGQPIPVETPEGAYRVYAFVNDFRERRMTADGGLLVSGDEEAYAHNLLGIAREIQARPAQEASRGWIDYLSCRVERDLGPGGLRDTEWRRSVYFLDRWLRVLEPDPGAFARQVGWFEWAYLSESDGSGQPFLIQVPENYDPLKSWPLIVDLHGAGSDHRYYPWPARFGDDPLALHVSVLGRGRSGYRGTGEVDVLDVISYVRGHWNVDPDRIHLSGHSMGGGGTFWIGSRHPDIFATVRPMAGFVTNAAVENLRHVPMYAIHGPDDSVVPVTETRLLVGRLREAGGTAVLEEPAGAGHPLWRTAYRSIREGCLWTQPRYRVARPDSVALTATDEIARSAYWMRVAEWGAEGKPASLRGVWEDGRRLSIHTENVKALTVDLDASPVRPGERVAIRVNGRKVGRLALPLPSRIAMETEGESWSLSPVSGGASGKRFHFPGGAMALYHGEPMMVVYGTRGGRDVVEAMRRVAEAAARSPHPGWPFPEPWEDRPRRNMPVGGFPCVPDTAVSESDMAEWNLCLIGTARQNRVAERLASGMPVAVEGDSIVASDGFRWSVRGRAFGVLYVNPLHPHRLVYWTASDSEEYYRPLRPLMRSQNTTAPPDFVLMDARTNRCVAARRFDSRWEWEGGYSDSPRWTDEECRREDPARITASAVRRITDSDFALLDLEHEFLARNFSPDESRRMDWLAWAYDQRISTIALPGEIVSAWSASLGGEGVSCRFFPGPGPDTIRPDAMYRIAMMDWRPGSLITYLLMNTDIQPRDGGSLHDALRKYFSGNESKDT